MKLPRDGKGLPFEEWPNFAVTIDKPGLLDTLRVYPSPRRSPGPGEVELEVHSVALNFKEVLFAVEDTDAGGSVEFVAGEGVEIAADFLNIRREMRDPLGGVDQNLRANAMGHRGDRFDVVDGAE